MLVTEKTQKGLIWFHFKKSRTVFQLSPNGKLQVKWNSFEEKKILLKLLKSLFVSNNDKIFVKPEKQQTWISYPPPENFKLYWCDETTEYSQKPSLEKPSETSFSIDYSKVLGNIANLNIEGHPFEALDGLAHVIMMLHDKQQKEKLLPKLNNAYARLNSIQGYTFTDTLLKRNQTAKAIVLTLLSDVSDVLHEPIC